MQNTGMCKITSYFTGPQGPYGRGRVKKNCFFRYSVPNNFVYCMSVNDLDLSITLSNTLM